MLTVLSFCLSSSLFFIGHLFKCAVFIILLITKFTLLWESCFCGEWIVAQGLCVTAQKKKNHGSQKSIIDSFENVLKSCYILKKW